MCQEISESHGVGWDIYRNTKYHRNTDTWREVQLSLFTKLVHVWSGYMQSIASLSLVSNCIPYRMRLCENNKGKSISQIHPSDLCFQSNIWSFFRFDIYRFVGAIPSLRPKFVTAISCTTYKIRKAWTINNQGVHHRFGRSTYFNSLKSMLICDLSQVFFNNRSGSGLSLYQPRTIGKSPQLRLLRIGFRHFDSFSNSLG